jgi:CheY-like chemotaxis protein
MTENIEHRLQYKKYRILVAEDEENTRRATLRSLQLAGYYVEGAVNGSEAINKLNEAILICSYWIFECPIWTVLK